MRDPLLDFEPDRDVKLVVEVGANPPLFSPPMNHAARIQHEIESTLATRLPEVEVVLAERPTPASCGSSSTGPAGSTSTCASA